MTNEDFAKLSTQMKWNHIASVVTYITTVDKAYEKQMRGMKAKHSHQGKVEEYVNLRLDQLQRWDNVKGLYAEHRDELNNTLDTPIFQETKNIIERVFTMELDDALRKVLDGE